MQSAIHTAPGPVDPRELPLVLPHFGHLARRSGRNRAFSISFAMRMLPLTSRTMPTDIGVLVAPLKIFDRSALADLFVPGNRPLAGPPRNHHSFPVPLPDFGQLTFTLVCERSRSPNALARVVLF